MRIMTDEIAIFVVYFRMPSGVWVCKLRAEATSTWRLVEG